MSLAIETNATTIVPDRDLAVLPSESERMIEAYRAAGGDVKLTIYLGVDHDTVSRSGDASGNTKSPFGGIDGYSYEKGEAAETTR